MTKIIGLVMLGALMLTGVVATSAARCPSACTVLLKSERNTCSAACPKRKPGKHCRSACAATFKAAKTTCKAATNPTPPGCGRTTTTTSSTSTTTTNGAPTTTSTIANGNTATLTLNNYLAWCSVSVDGGAASTAAAQTLPFPKNAVVNLSGDKASTVFVFGYWVGTAGDTGPSHDTAMMTTVTMDTDKTVQACCPFANSPNTPCPFP